MKPTLLDYIFLIGGLAILIAIEGLVNNPTPLQYIAAIFIAFVYIIVKDKHLPRL